jgi:aminoglycoside phosphotransferase (APT) family kinase protein
VELIGQGMEGAVYDLGDGTVRKVWFERRVEDVLPLKAFLDELPELPFRTPRIREVSVVDGRTVSVEDKLTGVPLHEAGLAEKVALEAFVAVVEALRGTTPGPAAKALPVVNESFYQGSWGDSLGLLVKRRAGKSREYLARDVAGFDRVVEQVVEELQQLEPGELVVVHGDICPPNVLMDGPRVAAVLDWGFLSTAGDSTFEASLAAGFFDMYGPDARRLDSLLLDRFEQLGHDRERMRLYRHAYAIITATIYDEHGQDGHYRWCVDQLTR